MAPIYRFFLVPANHKGLSSFLQEPALVTLAAEYGATVLPDHPRGFHFPTGVSPPACFKSARSNMNDGGFCRVWEADDGRPGGAELQARMSEVWQQEDARRYTAADAFFPDVNNVPGDSQHLWIERIENVTVLVMAPPTWKHMPLLPSPLECKPLRVSDYWRLREDADVAPVDVGIVTLRYGPRT